jgi:hypothetical protein
MWCACSGVAAALDKATSASKKRTQIAADWRQIAADQDNICVNPSHLRHLRASRKALTQPWAL